MQFEFTFDEISNGPVMAKVWVQEGKYRMVTVVPALELARLNGKVWGWCHIGKRGGK